jgi:hypothetical protein
MNHPQTVLLWKLLSWLEPFSFITASEEFLANSARYKNEISNQEPYAAVECPVYSKRCGDVSLAST